MAIGEVHRPIAPAETQRAEEAPVLPFQITAITPTREGISINVHTAPPLAIPSHIRHNHWKKVVQTEQQKLIRFNSPKIHTTITDIHTDPLSRKVTLNVDARLNTYSRWFALGREEMPEEVKELVRHSAVSVSFITADNMLMFQFRSTDNNTYPGWLGAAASGGADIDPNSPLSRHNPRNRHIVRKENGQVDGQKSGLILDGITNDIFLDNAVKEAQEETGVIVDKASLTTLGLIRLGQKPVDEVIFIGKLPQTAEELTQQYTLAAEHHDPNEKDPMDNIGFIPATPQAIEKLVTQVDCPFNPSGLGAMLLTGYYLKLQEAYPEGQEVARQKAQEWLREVGEKAAQHYAILEAKTKEYVHNEQLKHLQTIFASIQQLPKEFQQPLVATLISVAEQLLTQPVRLNPHERPENQGLVPMEEALQQAGISYRRDGQVYGDLQAPQRLSIV